MRSFFLTAPGTGIGKTMVMTTLCWQLRQQGKQVTALKPIISGFDPQDENNDTALILKSCGLRLTPQLMQTISPWRFTAPLSPNMAASREKKCIDTQEATQFCREHAGLSDIVLVEGAGGVMSPINETHTNLDWMQALGWPVILVTGTYLGAISHALTSAESILSRGLELHALVVNESIEGDTPFDETVATMQSFLPASAMVAKMPRLPARDELWKHAPLISWMCQP